MTAATLDSVADALDTHGVRYETRGGRIRTDCPACGKTDRRGRRPVVISEKLGALIAYANCGCRLVDIARALDLAKASLLSYSNSKTNPPSTRNASGKTGVEERTSRPSAYTTSRGGPLAQTEFWKGMKNPKGLRRTAEEIDRRLARPRHALDPWITLDSRGLAEDLGTDDRRTVQKNLDWFVAHGFLEERQLPAPDEEVTDKAGKKLASKSGGRVYKSGPKQYRLLNEAQQIRRLTRRADP
jgi:hypothetical protein